MNTSRLALIALLRGGFFSTSDPTGADALFAIDLNGADTTPSVFTSDFATASVQPAHPSVPEPSTMLFLLIALPLLLWERKHVESPTRAGIR